MTRQMTATQVKTRFLALLDEVEKGEEIEITRHGLTIARLAPAKGPHALENLFAGIAVTAGKPEDLYSTDESWEFD